MTTENNSNQILYTDLDQLAKMSAEGGIISPGTSALIGGASAGIGGLIKAGTFGNNKILKLALSSGDVINKVATISFEFAYNEEGVVSGINVLDPNNVGHAISVDIFNGLVDTTLEYTLSAALLLAAAPLIGGFGAAGFIVGAIVTAAGVSYNFPYIRGFTDDAFNNLVYGNSTVDMQFTNSSGVHDSGLFFKDGMGDLSDKGAIAYFLANSGEANVDFGTFDFAVSGGLDRGYKIYDAAVYQVVADRLGITLNQFLDAGNDGAKNGDNYIDNFAKIILRHEDGVIDNNSAIYIPVVVNGVTQVITVESIFYNGSVAAGKSSFGIDDNPYILALTNDGNVSMVIKKYQSYEYDEIIIGNDGNNNINYNTDGNDTITSLNGDDAINAGYGSNIIDGGEGSDTVDYSFLEFGSRDMNINLITNEAKNSYFSINQVNDTIYNIENIIASNGDDTITGNDSINTIKGNEGHDSISGGKGNDFLYGDSGSDSLSGDEGKDFLSGGSDDDYLSGGADNDTLLGNDGDDTLSGGKGNDLLQGGAGFDTYSVTESLLGIDVISDSDRSGQITIDGNILTGEAKYIDVEEDNGLHQLTVGSNNYYLKMNGGMLFIARNEENITAMKTDNNVIVIQSFTNGQFGITLEHPEKEGEIGSGIGDFLKSIGLGEATQPVFRYDPLTLDLDGDGIELVSLTDSNTFFDLDNDGLRENVGWVKADDGILILDGNNNGTVDNIEELFGYRNPDGTEVTGTQELATHDSNADGKIDNNDSVFSNLKIWQDLNQDGISQENELKSLTDYRITSIDVNSNNLNQLNQNVEGNVIISTGAYTKEVTQTTTDENGNIITITTQVTNQYANLDLAIDQTNSSHYDYQDNAGNNITYDLNIDTLFLPQSRGYGNTVAWHIAMSQDGTLLSIMQDAVNLTNNTSYQNLDSKVEEFLYRWTNTESVTGMRGRFDGKKLATMEELRGIPYLDVSGSNNVNDSQLNFVQAAWDSLLLAIKAKILIQGTLKDVFDGVSYDFETDELDFSNITSEEFFDNVKTKYESLEYADGIYFLREISDLENVIVDGVADIADTDQFKALLKAEIGFLAEEVLFGTAGNDVISKYAEEDYFVDGGEGSDNIYIGGYSDDVITGGKGDDAVSGNGGDDVYIYNVGDGKDAITEHLYDNDKIKLGAGITKDDIYFTKPNNSDLVINFRSGNEDQIILKNHISSGYRVETLEFSDGSIIDLINDAILEYEGTDGADYINASNYASNYSDKIIAKGGDDYIDSGNGNDIVNAGDGDDTIISGSGNDAITGGKGDDIITVINGDGNQGDDTYIYNIGDGKDTIIEFNGSAWIFDYGNDVIQFGEGITKDGIYFTAENNISLVIHFRDSITDQIVLGNYFYAAGNKIEALKFFDGSTLDISDPNALTFEYEGTENADNIRRPDYAQNSKDIINSKGGNDVIDAGGGDDLIDAGDGNDSINAGDGNDIITGGKGDDNISSFANIGDDIYIYNIGDGKDVISESGRFGSESYGNDKIKFGEGITKDDIYFSRFLTTLIIKFRNNDSDQIEIGGQISSNRNKIETLEFFDGSTIDLTDLSQVAFEYVGTDAAETFAMSAYDYKNNIDAKAGDDRIELANGDDVIDAGEGNDLIYSGGGNDTHIYNKGDGSDRIEEILGNGFSVGGADKIKFGEGITRDSIYFVKEGGNLIVKFKDNASDQILVGGHFSSSLSKVESIEFSDGSVFDLTNFDPSSITNNTPLATNDALATDGKASLIINLSDILANDYDVEDGSAIGNISINDVIFANPAHGVIVKNANGTATYTQNSGYVGMDQITYQIRDSGGALSNFATIDITVTEVDMAAVNDTFALNEDNVIVLSLADILANDSGAEAITSVNDLVFTNPDHGSLVVNAVNNTVIYTPNSNYNGVDEFSYQIKDGNGGLSNAATINLNISLVNDAPVAADDSFLGVEDNSVTITFASILANDFDVEDGLAIQNLTGDNIIFGNPAHGTIIKTDTGIIYTPNSNYNGADVVSYQIKDSNGVLSNSAKISLNVSAVNDAPTVSAIIPSQSGKAGNAFTYTIPAIAFTDIDNDALTYSAIQSNGSALPAWLTFNSSTKTFSGTPTSGIATALSILVTANDGSISATQTFAINIATNVINGTTGNDVVTGTSSNDVISGFAGNDIITGGLGSDAINGGNGTDTISYTDSTAAVTVNLITNINSGGSAAGDTLTNIENITGSSFNDNITGNSSANTINAGDGNDTILGGLGSDTINGGNGIDTVSYADSTVAVTVNLATNTNKNGTAAGDKLSNIENITGSSFNDNITGSTGNNVINGGNGNDTISAGTGNDKLIGGLGKDSLTGGSGNDIFTFTSLADSNINSSDLITDFTKGQDQIDFSGLGFSSIVNGTSSADDSVLHYYYSGSNTIIEDHDLTFKVTLTGKIALSDSDFDFV